MLACLAALGKHFSANTFSSLRDEERESDFASVIVDRSQGHAHAGEARASKRICETTRRSKPLRHTRCTSLFHVGCIALHRKASPLLASELLYQSTFASRTAGRQSRISFEVFLRVGHDYCLRLFSRRRLCNAKQRRSRARQKRKQSTTSPSETQKASDADKARRRNFASSAFTQRKSLGTATLSKLSD